jgi:small subunit ribosomal protein S13
MARIAGVDLPREKSIGVAMTYIFGIGRSSALRICEVAGIKPHTKTHQLDESEVIRIRDELERAYKVEGDLRRDTTQNIKMLMDMGCYRGLRHRRGMPVRGQRTHTNARTRKGPRKTVAGKKKAPTKK